LSFLDKEGPRDKLIAAFLGALGTALAQELVKDVFSFLRRKLGRKKDEEQVGEDKDGTG